MIVLTLLQSDLIPVVMGPAGSIILFVFTVLLGLANAYQWHKSTKASHWQGTAEAYKEELVIVRERADRLSNENSEMVKGLADLKAKTDLSSLERLNIDADRRNQEIHERILLSLGTILESNATHHAQFTAVASENTHAIRIISEQMTKEFQLHRIEFEMHQKAFAEITVALQEKADKSTDIMK